MSLSEDKTMSLISAGSEITGAASGAAIGFLMGGPLGAAVGGLWGVVIRRTLSDITGRILSHRETARVGATATFAVTKIKERLDSGDKLRNDGFFDNKEKARSYAEEIFEGVLLKAKNEHEEKKTKILGNIFANTAFFPGFSIGEVNRLLRIAENLTYRQMCILSLIKRKNQVQGIRLRGDSYSDYWQKVDKNMNVTLDETVSTVQEAYEMYGLGLILCKDENDAGGFWSMTEWTGIAPNRLGLTPMGEKYYQVMGLDDVSQEDVREVARYLS